MLLKEFPSSANTADLLSVFRDRILLSYAKEHNYNFIIKALNGDSLAIETFKFFTKGIGGNIPELCEQ